MHLKPKSVKAALAGVVHTLLLGKSNNTRIKRLMDIAKEMESLADKLKVRALTEEYGEERIAKAREVMDEALREIWECYRDDWESAIDTAMDGLGEHGELCEALNYLEDSEDGEEEEENQ